MAIRKYRRRFPAPDEHEGAVTTTPSHQPAFKVAERDRNHHDADSISHLQRTAGNAAVVGVLQRAAGKKRAGAPHVGAVESGFEVDGVAPGRGGYTSRMMTEAADMAEDLRQSGGMSNITLRQVAPDVSGVAAQERAVGRAKALWEGQTGGLNLPSTDAVYQGWADGCQRWLDGVAGDKRTLQMRAESFNAFVPRANAFAVSAGRLGSMQALVGATDNHSLVSALQEGLADALLVAGKYRDAIESSDSGKGPETLDVPAQDDTVESQAKEVTLATKDLNTAYLGFRIAMTTGEIEEVEKEGTADRARLAQINQVKAAVRGLGKVIDTSMAVVSGAPAAVANVTNTMRRTEAQFNAMRNRGQIMKGKRPTHNPTYLTTDSEGNMIVANAQTGLQGVPGKKNDAGEKDQSPIPESGITLPTSVENILGGITDFIYAGEVRDINIRLQGIANRVAAVQSWAAGAKITQAIEAFQNSLNEFAKRCNDLQQRIAARRNSYLQFGVQLDRFARANKELAKEGLSTDKGAERYTTIMAIAGQVREVLSLGRNAAGGFGDARTFAQWVVEAHERRESSSAFSHRSAPMSNPPFWVVPSYGFTPGEEKAIGPIFTQMKQFETMIAQVQEIFGPVDVAAGELFTHERVSPGGGSGAY